VPNNPDKAFPNLSVQVVLGAAVAEIVGAAGVLLGTLGFNQENME
jgi:hypothetical protein